MTLVAAAVVLLTAACNPEAEGRSRDLINDARARAGLAPLIEHPALTEQAREWAAQLASTGRLAHSDLPGDMTVPWEALGENVAVGASVEENHRALMASATHRANILGRWTHVGVGVVDGPDGRTWEVQIFLRAP